MKLSAANKRIIDNWIVSEIQKAQAVWLHAFYATMIPRELFDEAAKNNYERARKYAKEQGYTIHFYKTATGGFTEIHKADLVVARFEPVSVPGPDHVMLSFKAHVLGKVIPTESLTKHLRDN